MTGMATASSAIAFGTRHACLPITLMRMDGQTGRQTDQAGKPVASQ